MASETDYGHGSIALRHIQRQLISLKTLAERWGTSRATVRRRLKAAGVAVYYLGGSGRNSTLRYAVDEVEDFLRRTMSM